MPESLLTRALATPTGDAFAERILDAALAQFCEVGLSRATVEDVARRAGTARVTVYRRFATKNVLVEAVLMREFSRFISELDATIAELPRIEDRIVEGFAFGLGYARAHPLVGGMLRMEPELVLPFMTIRAGPVLAAARGHLAAQLPFPGGEAVAELMVRITVSFVTGPDSCIPLATDDDAREFALRFLVPLVQ
ncbi:TetR family transcriptional regulator [Actinomycetes bacterium KLBMP 9759]